MLWTVTVALSRWDSLMPVCTSARCFDGLHPRALACPMAMAREYTAPYRDVVRARVTLFAAAGWRNDLIAARLDMPTQHVSKWRKRFCKERLAGLIDRPRR